MANSERIGHFIRQWRQHRGLTLEQLAERIGSTHATLSRIERGLMPYSQPTLEKLAAELGTEPASLVMRDPTDPEGIWSVWDTLSVPERRQAVAIIRAVKTEKAGTGQ